MAKGVYIVVIDQPGRTNPVIRRVEVDDTQLKSLNLRLEALFEAGVVEDYSIQPQALPPLATEESIFTALFPANRSLAKQAVFRARWEGGWRNRDPYFHRNAERHIR